MMACGFGRRNWTVCRNKASKHVLVCLVFIFPLSSFVSTLSSCTNRYLSPSYPITFNSKHSCLALEKRDLQFQSFVAIVHSLDVQKWLFIAIDRAGYKVVAQVGGCMYPTRMNITVDPEGLITFSRSHPGKISRVHANWLHRWMTQLERTFHLYRCQSIGSLLEQVERYWVKPRLTRN